MRKFNKLFILISIILLSLTCISCKKSDEDRIREIFKLEQLNMYIDISNEKSEIVSRLKDSVEWSNELKRDVDYYDLNDIYNLKEIKHLNYNRNEYLSARTSVDVEYIPEILDLISSVPYVEVEDHTSLILSEIGNQIHFFIDDCYSTSHCDTKERDIHIIIYTSKYVEIRISWFEEIYVSLIPLDDRLRKVLSDENILVHIYGKELD